MRAGVRLHVSDRVAVITLDRPGVLNAMDLGMVAELERSFERVDADEEIWACVLTGAGERAFSAGADLKSIAGQDPSTLRDAGRHLMRREHVKPVIAAVNGLAFGGGLELVLACDLAVASDRATFGLPEVRWGLVAAGGGAIRLPRVVPQKVAAYHAMTGEPMSAADALRWGLVNQVVAPAELMPAALDLARRICENAPQAVRATRKLIERTVGMELADAWAFSDAQADEAAASEDAREGPLAFACKRKPAWTGR